ncbi:transcriptional regulator [Rhodoglobus vestalii]|uniref:Transcriptional regulator n=1 Tax=Rhodoglobus vestalii TaxID=193384 RepID=A0A8H2PWW1_9MICO|nr:transcriptional regulator [Rhodoglobus vestalii]
MVPAAVVAINLLVCNGKLAQISGLTPGTGRPEPMSRNTQLDIWTELAHTNVVLITNGRTIAGADSSHSAPQGHEARTRDRVRQTIAEDGPLTAADLASRLGVTSAAVRRHLDLLADNGTIEERTLAIAGGRSRGRPARAYILSEAGHAGMESDYANLAASALQFLAKHAGADAVDEFAREHSAQFEARYAAQLATVGTDVAARAQALATALSADGFAASTRPVGPDMPTAGVQLCQGHCPIQHVATQFPAFCDAEADAFSQLLGVRVERQTTLANGEHACTTFIPLSAVPVTTPSGTISPDNDSIQ